MSIQFVPGVSNAANEPITLFKIADESVTSSTTYQDDNHIVAIPLKANVRYAVEGFLVFVAAADGTEFKFRLNSTANFSDDVHLMAIIADTDTTTKTDLVIQSTAGSTLTVAGVATQGFRDDRHPSATLRGHIVVGSDATIDLEWAQQVSSANALNLKAGSWLRLTALI